jgi:2'-5' RNA ligase
MASTHRYFFAVFPSADARDLTALRAAGLQRSLGLRGHPVAASKLHATCHFIGSYEQPRTDIETAALGAGDAIAGPLEVPSTRR